MNRVKIREDSCMSRQPWVWSRVAGAGLLAAALGTAAFAADEPVNIVKYRKAFMGANGAHISMIAAIVKGEVSFTGDIAANAQALAEQGKLLTANLQQLFPEGTAKGETGEKSAALPVIWEKWAEFEQAAQKFEEESAKFAEVAQGGDQAAIAQQLGALGKQGCGNCHETFREKED
jgi:cytochrome c556